MTPPPRRGFLRFRVAGVDAALPLEVVRAVSAAVRVVEVPGCHPHVAGVVLDRGLALPVYDLRRLEPLWESPPGDAEPGSPNLIVCAWGEVLFGVLGHAVDLLDEGAAPGGTAAPEGAAGIGVAVHPGYRGRIVRRGRETVMVLDPAPLFASMGVPDPRVPGAGEVDGEEDPACR